jgi:tRNA-2-methylthio-N6-dimethylallyladenosine synthase
LDIVEKVKYAHAYSFKYSPRPGTPAALKEDQIDEEVKSSRLKTLQELIKQQTRDFNSSFLEREIDVLIEKKGIGEDRLTGRSSYLQPVHMSGDASLIGENLKVKIIKTRDNSLEGIIL